MKLLVFCSCLLAILFQAISASSFDSGDASLISVKPSPMKAKKVAVNESSKKKKPLSNKEKAAVKKPSKQEEADKSDKSKGVAVKEDTPKCSSEMLPKVLMKIVVDYFRDDDTYSILVSTLNWSLTRVPEIAIDSTRVYVATDSEGLKGLDHSSASLEESDRRYIEFGNPQWSDYRKISSSHDGRYVSFSRYYTQGGVGTKWFAQGNELEDGKPKRVRFGGEDFSYGLLSRNGQTLCSCDRVTEVTRVYQIKEETGKGPTAFMRVELNGELLAISGKGNRVMVERGDKLEIHDISKKGTSDLVCRIDANVDDDAYALNEDGSEAAYRQDDELRIAKLDKVVGGKVEPVIFTVKVPDPLGPIIKLVYSPGNKLHVLHDRSKVSLYDQLAKELVPIETPQEGQKIIKAAISPNADYFATLRYLREVRGKTVFETVVKRKLTTDDVMGFLGYEADKSASSSKQAKSPSEGQQNRGA